MSIICILQGANSSRMKKTEYRNIIDHLLLEHKITVKRFRSSNSGRANLKGRFVEIPDPVSIQRFVTCLHEIGHIQRDKSSYPVWKCEHRAIQYAERYCRDHCIDIPEKVIQHNKFYLKAKLCKGFIRGLNISKVDSDVLKYAGIDRIYWSKLLTHGFRPFTYQDTGRVIWTKK